jgi:hypothetical protein
VYGFEIRNIHYADVLFQESSPIKYQDLNDTPFEFIDQEHSLYRLADMLQKEKEFAVDLEVSGMSCCSYKCSMRDSCRITVIALIKDFRV